jgi:hypothetical protein
MTLYDEEPIEESRRGWRWNPLLLYTSGGGFTDLHLGLGAEGIVAMGDSTTPSPSQIVQPIAARGTCLLSLSPAFVCLVVFL